MDGLHGLSSELHSLSKRNASILWQQSRFLWLHEGDANTKYFHAISSITVDGAPLEGVAQVREMVFTHFENHFQALDINRPRVDNLHFSMLPLAKGALLTMPF